MGINRPVILLVFFSGDWLYKNTRLNDWSLRHTHTHTCLAMCQFGPPSTTDQFTSRGGKRRRGEGASSAHAAVGRESKCFPVIRFCKCQHASTVSQEREREREREKPGGIRQRDILQGCSYEQVLWNVNAIFNCNFNVDGWRNISV